MRSGKLTQDVYNCVGGTCDEFVSKVILVLGNLWYSLLYSTCKKVTFRLC